MNSWVYDKKTDLKVFGLSFLAAFLISALFPDGAFTKTLLVYTFIDISHSFTTYFFTLTSDRVNTTRHRYFFWGVLIGIFFIIFILLKLKFETMVINIWVYASIFHFMKQTQAWFFIANAKVGNHSKLEHFSNVFISYTAIWGPQIISMTLSNPSPWFEVGDVIKIPMVFRYLTITLMIISLIPYLYFEFKRWRETKTIALGKHFHLIMGCLIWFISRVLIFQDFLASLSGIMMMTTHSMAYLFLGQRYIRHRQVAGEKFWPYIKRHDLLVLWIWICTWILAASQWWAYNHSGQPLYIYALMLTGALTHYAFDSYMWKKAKHPEGASVFSTNL